MDHNAKQAELMSALRREMNGAVAGSMREKGMAYRLNHGVSLADVKSIATRFAPDHGFAKHIYGADIRELYLSAFLIADPQQVTAEELDFWKEGIITTETASIGALWLFSKSPAAGEIIFGFLGSDSPLLQYCALMTAAANITFTKGTPEWNWKDLLDAITNDILASPEKWSGYLLDGLAALLLRVSTYIPSSTATLGSFIDSTGPQMSQYLYEETGTAPLK